MSKIISRRSAGPILALALAACNLDPASPVAPPASPAAALEKAAANVLVDKRVKNVDFVRPFALKRSVTVPAGETMTAWTTRPSGSVTDPMVVAYYQTSGAAGDRAYRTQIVAFNDDGAGDRNSRFTWMNNTGSSKTVQVIAFSYNSHTTGVCTLWTRPTLQGVTGRSPGRISATRITGNAPVDPACSGPSQTRIGMARLFGENLPNGVIAVNMASRRGASIYHDDAVIALDEVLPAGQFILPYSIWDGTANIEDTKYNAWQWDRYTCPQ